MRGVVRKLAVLLVVAALGVSPYMARNWYVDVNSMVADPDGSPNRPYLAISDALNDTFFFTGDTIIVSPGTYNENVLVNGVAAHLVSVDGPAVTIIDGGGLGSTVHFNSAGASSLTGFTVTGGVAQFGGGIEIFDGSPTISRNIVTGNSAFEVGGGPAFGGGLDAYMADNVMVVNNLFIGNHADGAGGGIYLENCFEGQVNFNTVVGNTVGTGGMSYGPGIFLLNGTGTGSVRNNIVANNVSDVIPPIEAGGIELFNDNSTVEGNRLFQNASADLVIDEVVQPLPDGAGNAAADPRFVNMAGGDYRLLVDSPDVDAAVPAATPPAVDLDGNPRPLDGDGDASAVADRGCYENLGSLDNLVVSAASVVSWSNAFTVPGAYHVYRSTPSGLALGDAGACQDSRDGNLLDTQFTEPDLPALGEAFTFLAGFELNGADSALGVASDGLARQPLLLCP
jgi:hypothetical protein